MKFKLFALALLAATPALAVDLPPLGLQLWSIHDRLANDLPAGLADVKTFGFTALETAGLYEHSAQEMRALADARGLKFVSAHIPAVRFENDLPGVIAEAKTLGVTHVFIPWIPERARLGPAETRAVAAQLNQWGAARLHFGFHTHGSEFKPFADGTTAFALLLQETDPKLVACEMDVFWTAQAGLDPVALLQKYPGRFAALHLKDIRKEATTGLFGGHAQVADHVVVGQGRIDFPALLAAAPAAGVQYYILEDETSDPSHNIPRSVGYLATLGVKP
jgi:sugar phosphate isomerase/epimerase